jgi:hypothetical protein
MERNSAVAAVLSLSQLTIRVDHYRKISNSQLCPRIHASVQWDKQVRTSSKSDDGKRAIIDDHTSTVSYIT